MVTGTSSGAAIKGNSFNYRTSESLLSLNVLGPSSDLAFTGAENVDVTIKLRDKETNQVVDRTETEIKELPATSEETVDFKFSRVPVGDYEMIFDIDFECTFLTIGCENQDSYTADVLVPK